MFQTVKVVVKLLWDHRVLTFSYAAETCGAFSLLTRRVLILVTISTFQMFKFVAEGFLSRFRSTAGLAGTQLPVRTHGVCLLDDGNIVCPSLWERVFFAFSCVDMWQVENMLFSRRLH